MTTSDYDLHLFLGRVEGKLDAVIASQTALASRLDKGESAHGELRDRVTVLETRRSSLKDWAAHLMALLALALGALPHVKEFLR